MTYWEVSSLLTQRDERQVLTHRCYFLQKYHSHVRNTPVEVQSTQTQGIQTHGESNHMEDHRMKWQKYNVHMIIGVDLKPYNIRFTFME